MRHFVLICFIFPFLGFAQGPANNDKEDDKAEWKEKPFVDKMYVGGDFGLNFGQSYSMLLLSPIVGYSITEPFSVGVGVKYQWIKDHYYNQSSNLWGGSIFSRYLIGKYLLLHAELETLNVDNNSAWVQGSRDWVGMAFVGGGYRQGFGNTYFSIMLLYDLIDDRNSPYSLQYFTPYPLILKTSFVISLGGN